MVMQLLPAVHGPHGSVAAGASHPLLIPEPLESPVGELYVFRMRSHSEWEVVCSGFKSTSVLSGVYVFLSLSPCYAFSLALSWGRFCPLVECLQYLETFLFGTT